MRLSTRCGPFLWVTLLRLVLDPLLRLIVSGLLSLREVSYLSILRLFPPNGFL